MAQASDKFTFSIGEAIFQGWSLTKSNYGSLVKIALVYIAIELGWGVISNLLSSYMRSSVVGGLLMGLLSIGYTILILFVSMNAIRLLVKMVDGVKMGIEELFVVDWRMLLSYIANQLLVGLIVGIPMMIGMLMIVGVVGASIAAAILNINSDLVGLASGFGVGGALLFVAILIYAIYFGIALGQGRYLIVDKNMGPIESLKASWNITKGIKIKLLLLSLVLMLLNFGGMLLFLVGLLLTIPISVFAMVWIYRQLSTRLDDRGSVKIEMSEDAPKQVEAKTISKTATTAKSEAKTKAKSKPKKSSKNDEKSSKE